MLPRPRVLQTCPLSRLEEETSGPGGAALLCPGKGGGWQQTGPVAGGWSVPMSPEVKAELRYDGRDGQDCTGQEPGLGFSYRSEDHSF